MESELEKFVDFLFKGQNGFVYSPVKKTNSWESEFFAWPAQKSALLDHITVNGQHGDVYLCPSVFSKKEAKKSSFKSSNVVWVEFDGKEKIDFLDIPRPNAIVQSSSDTHLHCYWRIDTLSDANSIEQINRRLTYYLQADSSGWDATQLLRPPGTINHKRSLPVTLSYFAEQLFSNEISVFDKAPTVAKENVELTDAALVDPEVLLKELPILRSLKYKIEKEQPEVGHRSQFMFRVAHELAEAGCNHSQIASLLFYIDERIQKFGSTRPDRLARISDMASIAIHSIEQDEAVSLYSPTDIINHTDDLVWVFGKWLHSRGLMAISGTPGIGKTQFCLNLSYKFAVGEDFLDWPVSKCKVLFMSLEMDVRELKEIMKLQIIDFPNREAFDEQVRFLDEQGTYINYEDIIDEYNPDIVIIDSLLEIMDGDINDGKEVKAFTRWLRKLRRRHNCGIILIHHQRKPSGANKKPNKLEDLIGSVVLSKDIDSGMVLWQEEDQESIDAFLVKARFAAKESIRIGRSNHLTFNKVEEAEGETSSEQSEVNSRISFNVGFSG
jgi:hypothetical protein